MLNCFAVVRPTKCLKLGILFLLTGAQSLRCLWHSRSPTQQPFLLLTEPISFRCPRAVFFKGHSGPVGRNLDYFKPITVIPFCVSISDSEMGISCPVVSKQVKSTEGPVRKRHAPERHRAAHDLFSCGLRHCRQWVVPGDAATALLHHEGPVLGTETHSRWMGRKPWQERPWVPAATTEPLNSPVSELSCPGFLWHPFPYCLWPTWLLLNETQGSSEWASPSELLVT